VRGAKGLRSGENPARWRGGLEHSLPKRQRLTRGHHPALPWRDLPAFMVELRTRDATAALALDFLILTAARTGEVLGARWGEMDRGAEVWIVPAKRMKAGREHRVPLSAAALAILDRLAPLGTDPERLVFPGQRPGRPLSGMSMEMLLRRMNRDAITVHGFRSGFRDWCGDATSFPRELAEHALAHAAGDATERAYRREQAVERRREMMDAWARFLAGEAGARVIELRRTAGNGGQSS
jgi:integrase